jgi:hypothetical protein
LENGHVLRTAQINNATFNAGGAQGVVQEANWSGNLVWEFIYSNTQHHTHHDIEPMPNGNVLLIAWELKTAAQARQAGYSRNVALWPDHIVEVEPVGSSGGNIVWEWHAWNHLIQDYDATKDNYGVVANHPELLDINMVAGVGPQGGDWMHINAVSYNAERDEIVISSHTLNEIYVIDHSTTTAEAASHAGGNRGKGGDILYRWGSPANYDAPGTAYFRVVHCSVWIPEECPGAGHILAFNNREGLGTSIVAELVPPRDSLGNYALVPGSAYGPAVPIWTYTAAGFYSNHLGGCQRLRNGNTLIVESTSGYLFEVNASGAVQWSYARGGEIVRGLRYALDYPGVYALSPVARGEVVINEFLADNDTTVADQNGEYDDWIEFRNNSAREISLWGFYLSDDLANPTKWVFPDTSVAPGGYLIIWADEDTLQEGLHANFTLPTDSERVVFRAPDQAILDSVESGEQSADRSFGRYPNGTGAFIEMIPTFAAENRNDTPSIAQDYGGLPGQVALSQSYPNPFNASTTVTFELATTGEVTLSVHDVLGRRVATLISGVMPTGCHQARWNGCDEHGVAANSGVYFFTLRIGAFTQTRKTVLLK